MFHPQRVLHTQRALPAPLTLHIRSVYLRLAPGAGANFVRMRMAFPATDIVCYLKRDYLSCVCIICNESTRAGSLRGANPAWERLLGNKADFGDPSEGPDCSRVCRCLVDHRMWASFLLFVT